MGGSAALADEPLADQVIEVAYESTHTAQPQSQGKRRPGGVARFGIGGAVAGGRQYMSWIHDVGLVRAIEWLIEHGEIEGPVNLAAPAPLPQAEFMRELRRAVGMPLGIPAAAWMIEAAACVLGTDSELLLKSRRVGSVDA